MHMIACNFSFSNFYSVSDWFEGGKFAMNYIPIILIFSMCYAYSFNNKWSNSRGICVERRWKKLCPLGAILSKCTVKNLAQAFNEKKQKNCVHLNRNRWDFFFKKSHVCTIKSPNKYRYYGKINVKIICNRVCTDIRY